MNWKNADLESARKFLTDLDMETWLMARLVQLAFGDNASVAVKAIEMLLERPREVDTLDLDGLTPEELLKARARAEEWLTRAMNGGDK